MEKEQNKKLIEWELRLKSKKIKRTMLYITCYKRKKGNKIKHSPTMIRLP